MRNKLGSVCMYVCMYVLLVKSDFRFSSFAAYSSTGQALQIMYVLHSHTTRVERTDTTTKSEAGRPLETSQWSSVKSCLLKYIKDFKHKRG
jgi:hypothetical protein